MTWQAYFFHLLAIGLAILALLLALLACTARVSRLPSQPGVAAYRVEFRLGVEAWPERRP